MAKALPNKQIYVIPDQAQAFYADLCRFADNDSILFVTEQVNENLTNRLPEQTKRPDQTRQPTEATHQPARTKHQPDTSVNDALEVPENARLAITTSGSTASAKTIFLSAAALDFSARATLEYLRVTDKPTSWLLALPHTHIAGFQVLNRARLADGEVAYYPKDTSFTPDTFVAVTETMQHERKFTSLVPTQLHRLLADKRASDALARYEAVLVGGASLARPLADRARAVGVNLVHTYGMSETCGGCVYDGHALDGVEWALDSSDRILFRGPMLAENLDLCDHAGTTDWWRTSDLGHITAAGLLRVVGRSDDIIISGGVNVNPNLVVEKLHELPGAEEVVTLGIADEQWGQALAVVICSSTRPSLQDIQTLCRELPHPAYTPKRILWAQTLPQLSNGKIDRRQVQKILRETPETWENITAS